MYLLKKVIQLREQTHPEHEKPFLEHLEDLRIMITRIVITLLVAMVLCFAYNNRLMDFFRQPVDAVMLKQLQATLPDDAPRPISTELWKEARKVEQAAMGLDPEQRETYFRLLNDENLKFHAQSVSLLRAALNLPEERQADFLKALKDAPELVQQVASLIKTKPTTETQSHGNLNMMSALKPTEGFMLSMKLSFVAGIVISFPLLLLFILQFVLPGLHSQEKRVLWPALAIGFGLFLMGACFAYYLVLPRALLFFYEWSGNMGISNDWRIGEYISFATQFTLLFGLSFELPVVVMVFVKLGLLSYETMSKTRSYAILAIFVAAAILTPTPDIFTMLLMASPMIVLYEICIWLAFLDRKKNRIREEQEARERMERILRQEENTDSAAHTGSEADEDTWHSYPHESGDDGWHDDPTPHDAPVSDELPTIEAAPLPTAAAPHDSGTRPQDS
jgi:sec-independent protein translocase protein TatC